MKEVILIVNPSFKKNANVTYVGLPAYFVQFVSVMGSGSDSGDSVITT